MTRFSACTLVLLASLAAAQDAGHLFTCSSQKMTLRLRKDLEPGGGQNGWKRYWGVVDYSLAAGGQKVDGSTPALINRIDEESSGRKAFVLSLLSPEEAEMRRSGIEGGSVGFGSLDSRDGIEGSFAAKWALHSAWPGVATQVYFSILSDDLSCEAGE